MVPCFGLKGWMQCCGCVMGKCCMMFLPEKSDSFLLHLRILTELLPNLGTLRNSLSPGFQPRLRKQCPTFSKRPAVLLWWNCQSGDPSFSWGFTPPQRCSPKQSGLIHQELINQRVSRTTSTTIPTAYNHWLFGSLIESGWFDVSILLGWVVLGGPSQWLKWRCLLPRYFDWWLATQVNIPLG